MRRISRTKGIERLADFRERFRSVIADGYEHKAKSCATCNTPGACCLDEHFVNVRITRLEADAIKGVIESLPASTQSKIIKKAKAAIERYALSEGDAVEKTYACPLYDAVAGCIVHAAAKPLACIAHACYERLEDVPPDELLVEYETTVHDLSERVYTGRQTSHPIPLAIVKQSL